MQLEGEEEVGGCGWGRANGFMLIGGLLVWEVVEERVSTGGHPTKGGWTERRGGGGGGGGDESREAGGCSLRLWKDVMFCWDTLGT